MGLNRRASLYVDSCVFVVAFEDRSGARTPARKLLDALTSLPGLAVTSELTLAELVAPSPHAAMSLDERRRLYLEVFDDLRLVALLPVTRATLLGTAILREKYPHRLPDAIHLTTALAAGCSFFMSSDRDARRVPPALTWLTPSQQDVDSFLAAHD